jgi:DNA-binding response OmpR family regulator
MPTPGDLKDVLAQLRERYLAGSANTVAAFTQLADQLQRAPDAPEVIDALRRELHRLRGTAGSYGFHETSRLAAALEPVTQKWTNDRELDRSRRGAIVRKFVLALQASLTESGVSANEGFNDQKARILLVDVPEAAAARLVSEAIHRGYRVEQVTAEAVTALTEASPDSIVVAGPRADLRVSADTPIVMMRDADMPAPRATANMTIVDAGVDAHDLMMTIEARTPHSTVTGVTLLVIEDDPEMSVLLRAIGERQGMFVETRPDAGDIVETLQTVRPAVMLLDINLPGQNGLEVTRTLRQDPSFRELPIVLVSASTDVATRSAAFAAGADDFQSKPVSPEELMRRVERLLETQRQRQLALGIHPVTGIFLPPRALQVFDGELSAIAALANPATLAVVRPTHGVDGVLATASWHRELRMLAGALGADQVRIGFRDDIAVLLLFPMDSGATAARLEAFAEASQSDPVPWCAGLAELRPGAEPSTAQLARLAEEAWHLAREHGESVRIWDPVDTGIAPDVIVVEDDEALADLVTFALSARGLTWARFADGPAALEGLRAMRVRGRSPIVLLDVDLPGLDGFSLFERLRVERPGVFRVVFVSVHTSEADQLRAIRAGALDYMSKPVSLRVLMAKIAGWRVAAIQE